MDMAERALARGEVTEGTVFLAGRQTHGRGTGDRAFESGTPDGLWQTVVFDAPEPAAKAPIVFLSGVALAAMLRARYRVDAHPKWVNDVLVQGRKVSGTLVRRVGGKYLVGVGLNVNQTTMTGAAAAAGVSLRMLTGRTYDLADVWADTMLALAAEYADPAPLVARMRGACRMLGRTVLAVHAGDGRRARFTVVDLEDNGHLRVRGADGREQVWHSPDPWRITALE
jgi:BirA family biotin operon repressor/biotin-[acetyl-CoA-carboxylase] ligase